MGLVMTPIDEIRLALSKSTSNELKAELGQYMTPCSTADFRCFNGHTQVNATDLRQMRYPSREFLIQLGEWASTQASFSQHEIDRRIGALETEVWVADSPDHLIHFNGSRFLGPYPDKQITSKQT
jgi:hypothetical protein